MVSSCKKTIIAIIAVFLLVIPARSWGLASNNIPLDSPVYLFLEKLAAFGLVTSDVKGLRPFSRAEAARLLAEAEGNLQTLDDDAPPFAVRLIKRLKELLPREASLRNEPWAAPILDFNPTVDARLRYVYLDGAPRSYEREVNDPGGDRFFGISGTLRPKNPYPTPVQGHGSEGTPLLENNEGIVYRRGHNLEFRFSSEAYLKSYATVLVEPLFLYSERDRSTRAFLNKGYLKLGGGGLELEVGRDANWFGFGYRGNGVLTNNAKNFDQIKLSSPEPIDIRYIGAIKYAFIVSRFDRTVVDGLERRPYFIASKFSIKPWQSLEWGLTLGRQQGGPGVNNSLGDWVRGLYGGTYHDNSNSVAAFEFRLRLPFLRNTEIHFEDTFEDLPSAESYLVGIFIPRLTSDGRNDLRFEYFRGDNILYSHGTFREGYNYHGLPVGHSQGGATEDYFCRFSHWFSVRNNLALEYFRTTRGTFGRLPGQAVERKNAARVIWQLPLYGDLDMNLMYGWERIHNLNLVEGERRTNQIFKAELSYRY